MHQYGVLQLMDAVSIHYAPSWPARRRWFDWPVELENLRAVLDGHGYPNCQIWITETGISTVAASLAEKAAKEKEQQDYLLSLQTLPAARIYWAPLYDQQLAHPTDDALNLGVDPNPTAYHFGLKTVDGKPKPVFNTWRELNRAKHKVKWKLPTD